MKRVAMSWIIGVVLFGCNNHSEKNMDVEPSGASITRRLRGALDTEHWASITSIPHATGSFDVEEVFDVNHQGYMTEGYVRVRDRQGSWSREIWFEPKEKSVIVRENGPAERFSVPTDSAWIFAAIEGPQGQSLATPLGAWITYRATQAREVVRLIDLTQENSSLVPADQWSVATERGTTVVLGNHGATIDEHFVSALHEGQTDLVRQASATTNWFVFQRKPGTNSIDYSTDVFSMRGGSGTRRLERVGP